MFNKIMNSPYVLGALLSVLHAVHRMFTGNIATVLGLILPLSLIALYTYFTQKTFTKNFKYLTILTTFLVSMGITEFFYGGISAFLKGDATNPLHPGAVIITVTLTVLIACLINYLYLTYGNKLGLWILKKTK